MMFPDIWNWQTGDGLFIDKKKKLIKAGLKFMAKKYREELLPRKLREGFINHEVRILWECTERFIDFYDTEECKRGTCGWQDDMANNFQPPRKCKSAYTHDKREKYPHEYDPIYNMYRDFQAIGIVMLDQDTHYMVAAFVGLSMIFGRWPEMIARERHFFVNNKEWEKYKQMLLMKLDIETQPEADVTIKEQDDDVRRL